MLKIEIKEYDSNRNAYNLAYIDIPKMIHYANIPHVFDIEV